MVGSSDKLVKSTLICNGFPVKNTHTGFDAHNDFEKSRLAPAT
jgi:hypothetical protein